MRILVEPRYKHPEIDKAAYDAWMTCGDTRKATRELLSKGVINGRGKLTWTPDGVRKAAYRHMIRNVDEAKKTLMGLYYAQGYLVDEANVEKLLIRIAVGVLQTRYKVKYWLVQNNLLDKHRDYLKSLIEIGDE